MRYLVGDQSHSFVGRRDLSDRALADWELGSALAENPWTRRLDLDEPYSCDCLDRSLSELLDLLRALDSYHVEH